METLQLFLVLSLLGGLRYPVTTAIHGVCWAIGYASHGRRATPRATRSTATRTRSGNLLAEGLVGVIATTVGLAIGLLGGPV